MNNNSCPPGDALAAFACGELPRDSAMAIQSHLSGCDACLEVVGHLAARSFPAHEAGTFDQPLAAVGQQIGPYVLVRRVGEGGMGEVWAAQQTAPVRRLVALKLLKAGMDTRQIVARFEAERQMLAMMQHPGIAQIFDAGVTGRGRPYFAMEFVNGERITSYCDSASLALSDRLRLFQQVCHAVQHAHQKGVIHRDIKPSNVLVTLQDGKTQPKVIDFGLAKATSPEIEDASLTEMGTVLGTPAYASPEQMSMGLVDLDTRTDVYSLGALLYELLTGVIPFEMENASYSALVELRRSIRERDPVRPSTRVSSLGERARQIAEERRTDSSSLRRQLEGELDWIVTKALDKDRERRYGSPRELAADIQRFLDKEPLVAAPPTATYRARKFVQRHRVGTAFAVVVMSLLTAFLVVTLVQSQRIARERDRAEAEAAKARSINAFLQETLGSADPWQTGKDISIREVLGNAARKADTELKDQPLVAAAVKNTIGATYQGLGQLDEAEKLLLEALAVRRELLGDHDEVAESLGQLATLRRDKGDYEQAARYANEQVDLYRRLHGEEDEHVAAGLTHLAGILTTQGNYEEAKRTAMQAYGMLERRFGPDSAKVLDALKNLASVHAFTGEFAEASRRHQKHLEITLREYGSEHLRTAQSRNDMASAYALAQDPDKTVPLYTEALRIYANTLRPDHPETLIIKENLSNALVALKQFDAAFRLLDEVLAGRKANLGADAPQVVRTMVNIANAYSAAGRYAESIALYEVALPLYEKAYGMEHAENGFLQALFGRTLRRAGQLQRSEEVLRAEVERQPSRLSSDMNRAAAHIQFGGTLLELRKYAEAETHLLKGYALQEKMFGADSPKTKAVAKPLVQLYTETGQTDKAAAFTGSAVSQ